MGLYPSMYAGPFLECAHHAVTNTKVDFIHPPTTSCRGAKVREAEPGFCPKCGAALVKREVPQQGRSVTIQMAHDALPDDRLSIVPNEWLNRHDNETHIWTPVPGTKVDAPRDFDCEETQGVFRPDLFDQEGEKRWLALEFADEIEQLGKLYDSITVRWGFLATVS